MIVVIALAITIIVSVRYITETYTKKLDLDRLSLYLRIDIEAKKKILVDMVEAALNEYVIFNVNTVEEPYINEDGQNKMLTDIITTVLSGMTPAIIDNISVVYRASTIEELTSSINDIAQLYVLNTCIEINSRDYEKESPKRKPEINKIG